MKDLRNYYDELITSLFLGNDEKAQKIQVDKEMAYKLFLRETQPMKYNKPSYPIRRALWYSIAAIGLVLLGFWSSQVVNKNQLGAMSDIVVEVPVGARTSVKLPDGTSVWLNSNSRLVYTSDFGVKNRLVKMEGEGYFEVAHNKKIPFIIKSNTLNLKVLGTKFNFSDYSGDSISIVSLLEGSVQLESSQNQANKVNLLPNQRCELNKVTGEISVSAGKIQSSKAWTSGMLIFEDDLLSQIATRLEHYYKVKITIENPVLRDLRFYGDFYLEDNSLETILDNLSGTHKFNYSVKGKNVIIY